jgi:hypothetical protein
VTKRVEAVHRFDVPVERGFAYITDTANWSSYWPGFVRLDAASRWGEPGDTARLVTRLLGRERELVMTLRSFERNRSSPTRAVSPASRTRSTSGTSRAMGTDSATGSSSSTSLAVGSRDWSTAFCSRAQSGVRSRARSRRWTRLWRRSLRHSPSEPYSGSAQIE